MRWVGNKEQSDYMRFRQQQNRSRGMTKAEAWTYSSLRRTGHKWTFQAWWGCRLFDFWNEQLGIAVEVDGDGHDASFDAARDKYNYYRSGILVLRVRNFDEESLQAAIAEINKGGSKQERRKQIRRDLGLPDDECWKVVLAYVGLKPATCKWEVPKDYNKKPEAV